MFVAYPKDTVRVCLLDPQYASKVYETIKLPAKNRRNDDLVFIRNKCNRIRRVAHGSK
jgi:hypothetical protein